MTGSDIARAGASMVARMGLCTSVPGTGVWEAWSGISAIADGADTGGGGAARVGLGGDEDEDRGGEATEDGSDGSKAVVRSIGFDAGYAARFSIAVFGMKPAGGSAGMVTDTSGVCTFAERGLSTPVLLASRFDCRFSLRVAGRAPVGTGGRAVVGGGKGDVELAGEGAGERDGVVDRSLIVAEVDVRLDARRSVGTGGNGHVGGGAGGACDEDLEAGSGGRGAFGGAVVGGRNDVCFDEFALSGNGGRGTFGGGWGDGECCDGLTGDMPLAYSRDEKRRE